MRVRESYQLVHHMPNLFNSFIAQIQFDLKNILRATRERMLTSERHPRSLMQKKSGISQISTGLYGLRGHFLHVIDFNVSINSNTYMSNDFCYFSCAVLGPAIMTTTPLIRMASLGSTLSSPTCSSAVASVAMVRLSVFYICLFLRGEEYTRECCKSR